MKNKRDLEDYLCKVLDEKKFAFEEDVVFKFDVNTEHFTAENITRIQNWQKDWLSLYDESKFEFKELRTNYFGKPKVIKTLTLTYEEAFNFAYKKDFYWLKEFKRFCHSTSCYNLTPSLQKLINEKPYHFLALLADNFNEEKVTLRTSDVIRFLKENFTYDTLHKRFQKHLDIVTTLHKQKTQKSVFIRNLSYTTDVHTKYLESNFSNLYKLYKLFYEDSLPERTPDKEQLYEEFNLIGKQIIFHIRSLDPNKTINGFYDLGLTSLVLNQFTNGFDFDKIIVVENETTFLDLPDQENMLSIFGSGWTVCALRVQWLNDKKLYYFGDSDPEGYKIFRKFKEIYPNAQDILMGLGYPLEQEKIAPNLIQSTLQSL